MVETRKHLTSQYGFKGLCLLLECQSCGRKSAVSNLSNLMFSKADKEEILKGIGWIVTEQGMFCPVCSNPKMRAFKQSLTVSSNSQWFSSLLAVIQRTR